MTRRLVAASFVVWLVPLTAAAQGGAAAPASQGPMIVERIHSGFMAAPDVKVTQVDNTTSELAGGYAGWVTDDTFFVGGGGYWLANPSSDRKMAYGGLVVQWLARTDERIGFSAKGLLGGGQATLASTVTGIGLPPDLRGPFGRPGLDPLDRLPITTTRVRFHEGFFVAEPDVNVLVRLTRHLRLTGGVGYRFISAERHDDSRLRGATGSVALQIGGGS